jgi:hypothetical protein
MNVDCGSVASNGADAAVDSGATDTAVDRPIDAPVDGGGDGPSAPAASCAAVLARNAASADGVYTLDLDGTGPSPERSYYCDMANGGWTLVANQVPNTPLIDDTSTINAAGFGTTSQSYRLGVPDITTIHPTTGWKLTDPTNTVYFKPSCIVDWTVNYLTPNAVATVCTTGYTDLTFATIVNGGWQQVTARGIGINNGGSTCSIRMYEAHTDTLGNPQNGAGPAGIATPCDYQQYVTERVSLWFK